MSRCIRSLVVNRQVKIMFIFTTVSNDGATFGWRAIHLTGGAEPWRPGASALGHSLAPPQRTDKMDLFDSPWKILIVAVVIIVLFGSAKLPGAARSLGKSMRILKAEVKDLHEEETEPAMAQQLEAQQVAAQQVVAQQLEAQQAQQQIDALQRQLDDLKRPVAGAHAVQSTQQAG